ncbi:protein AE7-like [Bidens hawaiensis]|uniref:protein AE7-like n=1 Tax=Bidens hawaiensis TaxID=980011 RepID=UPI00404B5A69
MATALSKANPLVYEKKERPARTRPGDAGFHEYEPELIDQLEIFDILLNIKDPEHPYSLEELKVVTEDVDDKRSYVSVTFTPTIEHCSMAKLIGLCLRVKLIRSLPSRFKVEIRVASGTHKEEDTLNKQLNDKERVAAVLENPNLVDMVDECLTPSYE